MAKKDKKKQKAIAKAKAQMAGKKPPNRKKYYLWLLGCATLAIVFLPTTIVLAFGLIPTLVAILIDRSKERTAGMTVGMMNFAGCMPFLMELWSGEGTLQDAYDILLDPTTLLMVYGGAAVGWVIYFNVPPIVSMYLVRRYENRVREIKRRMDMLEEIWGGEVKNKVVDDEDDEEIQEAMEAPPQPETEKAAQPG